MKPINTEQEMRIRATEALRAVLAEVSGTKVREISHPSPDMGSEGAFTAGAGAFTTSVDVYGHHHTLICEIAPDDQPAHLRELLQQLHQNIAIKHTTATPVIIAPYISDEARAMCNESQAGFLDLEGNARIALGEVFILKRTIPNAVRRNATHDAVKPSTHHPAA
jgi:hypothetical protein